MREYLNRKLIVATLQSHVGQALTTDELCFITNIPKKTLKGLLRHLVHDALIQRKSIMCQKWDKKREHKYEEPRVWYYIDNTSEN